MINLCDEILGIWSDSREINNDWAHRVSQAKTLPTAWEKLNGFEKQVKQTQQKNQFN